jgi:hypothetical protein
MTKKHADNTAKSQLLSIESNLGLDDLFGGKMVKCTFRIPFNLREAVKQECKANGVSTCKIRAELDALWVVNSRSKKLAFGNTMSKLIDAKVSIGEMNFTQNVQSRPRRLMRNVEPTTMIVDSLRTCQVKGCCNEAVGKGVYLATGREHRLCKLHYTVYARSPKEWRLLR